MATQLRKYDWSLHAGGGRKYDWDKWLNGKPWKLVADEDFEVPIDSFRGAIWANARRHQLAVRVTKVNDKTLVIQTFEMAKV